MQFLARMTVSSDVCCPEHLKINWINLVLYLLFISLESHGQTEGIFFLHSACTKIRAIQQCKELRETELTRLGIYKKDCAMNEALPTMIFLQVELPGLTPHIYLSYHYPSIKYETHV